ncbi:MAG: hypothetical protein HYZ42_12185 [Bacteroidetes bacterium]|nr:hypothetical protein [Bacteroidota bacterium]
MNEPKKYIKPIALISLLLVSFQLLYTMVGTISLKVNEYHQFSLIEKEHHPKSLVTLSISVDEFKQYTHSKEICLDKHWYDIVSKKISKDKVTLTLLPDKIESQIKIQLSALNTSKNELSNRVLLTCCLVLFLLLVSQVPSPTVITTYINSYYQYLYGTKTIKVLYTPPKYLIYSRKNHENYFTF